MYDVIVVGAGIEGSATAYHLAKNGQTTLLLEQFPLPHSRGSSHGQSRITRKAYGSQEFYTEMMKEAYTLWDQLEKESMTSLYINSGCLVVGQDNNEFLNGTITSLTRHKMPFQKLSNADIKKRYPMTSYPSSVKGVLDITGGILRADKALKAFQDIFKQNGGVLHDGEPLLSVHPGDIVTVRTTKAEYKTKSLILTVGPWATKILPQLGLHLPLKPIRISVCYWKEGTPGQFSADKFPTLIDSDAENDVYLLPSLEYPGHVKVCLHTGPDIDPDRRDAADDGWVLYKMKNYVSRNLSGLESTPSIIESCIYTNTPDSDFILDRHPAWKNIIVGVGFSGHGFKLSPIVGKLLAELAMDKTPSYDMSPFKIDRFFGKSAKL